MVRLMIVLTLLVIAGCMPLPDPDDYQDLDMQALPSPWRSADVGMPLLSGSASYEDGRFLVEAAGRDIWSAPDEFHYVYQERSGDFEMIARVDSFEDTGRSAKAGVMVRESLDASAAYAFMRLNPEARSRGMFQYRVREGVSTEGGDAVDVGMPWWLRIVRSGDTIVGYHSSDGSSWVEAGRVNMDFDEGVFVGLAVTSYDEDARTRVSFGDVAVSAYEESELPVDDFPPVEFDDFALRGDPDFHPDQLSDEARLWYDRLWAAIEHPNQDPDADRHASGGNIFHYGRDLNQYMTALLMAFRATGDLRFLDEIDRLAEMMRGRLVTEWTDHSGSTRYSEHPGYRRWLYLRGEGSVHYGKDVHVMNVMLTHSLVATFTYAFHVNRDLSSPSQISYGERADFWLGYLQNDFEPLWRLRNNRQEGFPFIWRDITHPYNQFMRYNHYMWRMTDDIAYKNEVDRLLGWVMFEMVDCPAGSLPAHIWPSRFAEDENSPHDVMQHTTYVHHEISTHAELLLEGFYPELDADFMQRSANMLSQYADDGDPDDTGVRFARTLGGEQYRCGLATSDHRKRRAESNWARSLNGITALWDETGNVDRINAEVFENTESNHDNPRRIKIPVINLMQSISNQPS